jgi:DNA-binding FadR family transcriptional regulator
MQSFSPVSSSKLYIQIYNQIRDAILNGEFSVGDKLPSEKELCQMFNVSRVPVREALSALELSGLVESVHGAGVFVKEVNVVSNDWVHEIDPQEIIRTRQILEPEVARDAARSISEIERERLRGIMERFRAEAEKESYSSRTDEDFHRCLARASGNQMFIVLYDMIWKAMEQKMWSHIQERTINSEFYRQGNYAEHMQIGQAVLDGDADTAFEIMKLHMERLETRYWK